MQTSILEEETRAAIRRAKTAGYRHTYEALEQILQTLKTTETIFRIGSVEHDPRDPPKSGIHFKDVLTEQRQ